MTLSAVCVGGGKTKHDQLYTRCERIRIDVTIGICILCINLCMHLCLILLSSQPMLCSSALYGM